MNGVKALWNGNNKMDFSQLNFLKDSLKGKISYLVESKPLGGYLIVLKKHEDLFSIMSFLKNSTVTSCDQLLDLLGNRLPNRRM